MITLHHLRQMLSIQMHIDFGRRNRLVAKHQLYRPQIGAILEQVRRERMPQRMRADEFLQADLFGQVLNNGEYHGARQLPSAAV